MRFNGDECAEVAVQFAADTAGGFPVLRAIDHGESRLVLPFADGSLYDEAVVFSQRDFFGYSAIGSRSAPLFPERLRRHSIVRWAGTQRDDSVVCS